MKKKQKPKPLDQKKISKILGSTMGPIPAKQKQQMAAASPLQPKRQRGCFICGASGQMCDVCGEAEPACDCESRGEDLRDCEDCEGTGIASADR